MTRWHLLLAASAAATLGCVEEHPRLTSVALEDLHVEPAQISGAPGYRGSFRLVIEAAPDNREPALAVASEPNIAPVDATGQPAWPSFHVVAAADRAGPLSIAPGAKGSLVISFEADGGLPNGGWEGQCSAERLSALRIFGSVADETGNDLSYEANAPAGAPAPIEPSGFASSFGFLAGDGGDQVVDSLAVDGAGDLLWTGFWSSPADPPGSLGPRVLRKHTTQGDLLAEIALPSATSLPVATKPSWVVAGAGSTYLAGAFAGSFDLGLGSPSASAGSSDAFVARLEADASPAWVRQFGDASAQVLDAVTVDASGAVVFAVYDQGGATEFGVGANGIGIEAVTKLDASGATLWTRRIGDAWVTQMAPTPFGGVVLGGTLSTPTDFGGGTLVAPSVFLLEIDAAGEHVRSAVLAGSELDHLVRIAPMSGGGLLVVLGRSLRALDPSGALVWQHDLSDFGAEIVDAAVTGDDRILVMLDTEDDLALDGAVVLAGIHSSRRLLVSFDAGGSLGRAGTIQCADQLGMGFGQLAFRPAPGGGDFVLASSFAGIAMPSNTPFTSAGRYDAIIAGITP